MAKGPEQSLLWSEEFTNHNGGQLPEDTWNYDLGDGASAGLIGWGNNELQYYTSKRAKNARIENGKLIIEAVKENFEDKGCVAS